MVNSSEKKTARDFSARQIRQLGCEAETALPMLKVIALNNDLEVEKMAKTSIEEITLDCMAKKKNI